VVFGYFLLPARLRNGWLLGCSWFFYLCAGVRTFPFLVITAVAIYLMALALERRPSKALLGSSLALFIGVLFLFKYLDWGASLLQRALAGLGLDWAPAIPKLLLPAGISFYFFTAMGYLIDVYRGKLPAERSFVRCALLLSFFPCLLSGPIGRGEGILPQFKTEHSFQYMDGRVGAIRFLWGAFKKLVLADRLALVVETVFATPEKFGSLQLLLAACAFSIQIYCDFSAYSDMAIGSAKVMGFSVAENFRTPYFSRSIAEFWRRWHISLSSWFRDYLYIPLGGSRRGEGRKWVNVLIVFTVSGLWHGAAASFLVWGLLNGLYQVVGGLTQRPRSMLRSILPWKDGEGLMAVWQMAWVFGLSTLAWIFFKAGSVSGALNILGNLFKPVLWDVGGLAAMGLTGREALLVGASVVLLTAVDASSQRSDPALRVAQGPRWVRWLVTLGLLLASVVFGSYGAGFDPGSFIYGQF